MKNRLDKELVGRGLFSSRARAVQAIEKGLVLVDGVVAKRASQVVTEQTIIQAEKLGYVSRAQQKLEQAFVDFKISADGAICVDVGASTGGFTKCLLEHGAKQVIAVDTGEGQLHPSLAQDERVVSKEKTNFLTLPTSILSSAQLVVIDVSFVSLTAFVPKLCECDCPIVALIKPQFECGKTYAKQHKGVVKDPKMHIQILKSVVECFEQRGLYLQNMTVSPILGGDGNAEFLALFEKNKPIIHVDITKIVEKVPKKE